MDISKVPELVDRVNYELLPEAYEAEPTVRDKIFDMRPVSADQFYGTKGTAMVMGGQLIERVDGGNHQDMEIVTGPTWYLKVRQFSRKILLPERMLRGSNAVGRITDLIGETAKGVGFSAQIQKEDYAADLLQKGTLTAGDTSIFDGSFPGNADPNPGVIFDGLPFFDTAHTITVGATTYANHTVAAALSSTTLQTAKVLMQATNAVNERGERISIRPDTLIVPPQLQDTAHVLLNSNQLPGSANNDTNIHRGSLGLIVWDALTDDADAWWLCQAGKGVRFLDSGMPRMRTFWDEQTSEWVVVWEMWYGQAVTDWRYWYNANKAAA